jgi:hypothetical protein
VKLVIAPVPRPLAKRRHTTKKAWSTIGSVTARVRSAKRELTSSGARRPQSARSATAVNGIPSATTLFASGPHAQATMPSSSTLHRITASPRALPSA